MPSPNPFQTPTEYDKAQGSVHLQGLGRTPAKPARDFRVGERIMWNYGYVSLIESIVPSASGKTLVMGLRKGNGQLNSRRVGADRLLALA